MSTGFRLAAGQNNCSSFFRYARVVSPHRVIANCPAPSTPYRPSKSVCSYNNPNTNHTALLLIRYKLGPNGAIMTSLNLFATKFDQVLELLDKRSDQVDVVLVDTPGQIEAFNWSASGTIILGTSCFSRPLSCSCFVFPLPP